MIEQLMKANREVDALIRHLQMRGPDMALAKTTARQRRDFVRQTEVLARTVELSLERMTNQARPANYDEMQALEAGDRT